MTRLLEDGKQCCTQFYPYPPPSRYLLKNSAASIFAVEVNTGLGI
jgi:hypothetical protein